MSNQTTTTWIFGLDTCIEAPAVTQFPVEVLVLNSLLTLKDLGAVLDPAIDSKLPIILGLLLANPNPEVLDKVRPYMQRVYVEAHKQFQNFPIQLE